MGKEGRRKSSFVLFVMAIFFAGIVLAEFHSSIWMVVIAGVVLLAASCLFIWDRDEANEQTPSEKTSEILLADRMAELMRGNEKAEKGVYIAVKKQHESMEEGMAALEARISELVEAQENAVKTLVRYNKENARQIALSERDELERLCKELQDGFNSLTAQLQNKDFIEEVTAPTVAATKQTGGRIYEELHESNEAILSELESTSDAVAEMKELLSEWVNSNVHEKFGNLVNTLPRVPLDALVSLEQMEEDEEEPEDEPVAEPVMDFESEPFEEPLETEEPAPIEEPEPVIESEPVAEAEPEDAFASSGVDLSDPNRTLSADDIAALIASMGN